MAKDPVQSGYKPTQDSILTLLGLTLLASQSTETLLKNAIMFVLRDDPIHSVEELRALAEKHDRQTLGALMKSLKDATPLDPAFEQRLDRFLSSRNTVVHNVYRMPNGFDLHSDEGRANIKSFLMELRQDAEYVSNQLLGLLRAWSRQAGMAFDEMQLTEKMKAKLDNEIIPAIPRTFGLR